MNRIYLFPSLSLFDPFGVFAERTGVVGGTGFSLISEPLLQKINKFIIKLIVKQERACE